MSIESYSSLKSNNLEGLNLMKNSANALFLGFRPVIYDLSIPDSNSLKRLTNLFQDSLNGKTILPEEVNCCTPNYESKNIELDFGDKAFNRVERGLEFCFNTSDKYDSLPIFVHLYLEKELFGKENFEKGIFYRIREGKREDLENQVKKYFNREELNKFEEIAEFMHPYILNLDKPAKVGEF